MEYLLFGAKAASIFFGVLSAICFVGGAFISIFARGADREVLIGLYSGLSGRNLRRFIICWALWLALKFAMGV